jgi:hypothetical protein
MIATLFGKKKLTEDKLANVFVNAVLELTAEGFPTVAAELNESPEFEVSPDIKECDDRAFAVIVLTGNLIEMQRIVGPGLDRRLYSLSLSKFAAALGTTASELESEVKALKDRMDRLNFPSKNTVYAMSKVLFNEYELFCFQAAYFREQRSPNPIILKRMNGLMGYFLWNWSEVLEQYRIV